jgi:hypothetical protein
MRRLPCSCPWKSLLGLAVLVTALNAVKPLHIDDAAYYYCARQLADHPLDPFGFAQFWWDHPESANHVLAPPVPVYWWALAIRLFGDRPVLWKVWLLPIVLLLVLALYLLFRRFARGLELPLVWLTVLSPAVLPGFNLMLDVPALALAFAALEMFLRAGERRSFPLAALSGLVAGLAMQSKYTAAVMPAVMLLYAVLWGRLRWWLVAAGVAGMVFAGWELFTFLRYGESHFLYAGAQRLGPLGDKVSLFFPLLMGVGGVAPAVLLLGLAALRARWWVLTTAVGLVLTGFVLVAVLGADFRASWGAHPWIVALSELAREPIEVEFVLFGLLGALTFGTLAVVAWRLCRRPWQARRVEWFLVLWLGLEILGYFGLSPFPAVRRILGVLVVATLLAGRLASRTCRAPGRRRLVWGIAAGGAVLGLGFAALDLYEARVIQDAAETAARSARKAGDGRIYFLGHWGMQFYGERAGMTLYVPAYDWWQGPIALPPPTELHRGDLVVWPEGEIHLQETKLADAPLELVRLLEWRDGIPLRTVACFYDGPAPLRHLSGPRLRVRIWRATGDFKP